MQFNLYSVNNKFISSWQGALFEKVDCREGGWDDRSMEVEIMFHFIIKRNSVIVPIISAVGRIWKGLIWSTSLCLPKAHWHQVVNCPGFFLYYREIIIQVLLHLFFKFYCILWKRVREDEKLLSASRYFLCGKKVDGLLHPAKFSDGKLKSPIVKSHF